MAGQGRMNHCLGSTSVCVAGDRSGLVGVFNYDIVAIMSRNFPDKLGRPRARWTKRRVCQHKQRTYDAATFLINSIVQFSVK